ncbi:hypothetical protein [Nonlabens sp.]|uniref:hypothetical protein n=1 Tax=Nonlabens sp. TaxID=1888209 RepID=UPI0025CF8DCF|nr:hypothetical protein [Nonlabens sp.]
MATGFATAPATLANLSHLTPRPVKGLFGDNYLSVADMSWTQQFLPEVYEKEVERYGNRTISGFLRMVGAEMPMASDQVIWSEQGRLHIAYDTAISNTPGASQTIGLPSPGADGKVPLLGPGMTIVISKGNVTNKAFIKSVGALAGGVQTYNIQVYDTADSFLSATLQGATSLAPLNLFVFGSEYGKGSVLAGNSIDASFTTYSNKPIILRDKYRVNGSDVAQIGWVEVTTEIGTGGYLWYLKSEHESRIRFEDYLEMSMVEGELAQSVFTDASGATIEGTQGLFSTLEDRGLVFNDPNFSAIVAPTGISQFDSILQELDKQGAIEENMLFLDRSTSLSIDNMLANQNSYGAGGTSYGVFDNSEDMALNLGFSGFRRGAYDFYKTDWKYLNDSTTRGLIDDIKGVLVPAGTSTVYDQQLGQNISRPFLHIRYRASEADDRRLKSWVTGSVGGNYTSDADEMNVHFLSERTMCTQAANNFVLFKAT